MTEATFFATTARGVEDVLARELRSIGVDKVYVERGGVRFNGDLRACYLANLRLRTASRVLMRLREFECRSPQELYDGVRSVAWVQFLNPEMTLAVDCNLRDSILKHSGSSALKAKDAVVDAIRDRYGRRPNVNVRDPDVRINLHIARDHCTVSLDTSGATLDKRGYRLDTGEAPLRETLAAALVEMTEWDGAAPFADPMCGSGTIPIEAAMKALDIPPGLNRSFGFERLPDFDPRLWREMLSRSRDKILRTPVTEVSAGDVSGRMVKIAGANAARAGVAEMVKFVVADIEQFVPPSRPGIMLINPPYGSRLGEEDSLRILYRKIGDVMKQRCSGHTAFIFTGNPELAKSVGLRPSWRKVLFNGPIECRLLKYVLY